MIRINLLPVEKRKREKTPLPRVGLVFLNGLVFAGALAICLFYWVWIKGEQDQVDELRKQRAGLQPAVDEYVKLTAEVNRLQLILGDIKGTANRKVEWWRAMDAVWEVIQANPKVWLSEIATLDDRGAEQAAKGWESDVNQPPFGLTLRCHCSGRDVSALKNFRMMLKERPEVKRWFEQVNWDVQYSLSEERDSLEGWSMEFEVKMLGRKQVIDATGSVNLMGVTR